METISPWEKLVDDYEKAGSDTASDAGKCAVVQTKVPFGHISCLLKQVGSTCDFALRTLKIASSLSQNQRNSGKET